MIESSAFPPDQQPDSCTDCCQFTSCCFQIVNKSGVGRVPAFEIWLVLQPFEPYSRQPNASGIGYDGVFRSVGMVTMDRALQDLIRSGEVSYTEAVRYANNVAAFKNLGG